MPKNLACLLKVMTNLAYNMFSRHSGSARLQHVALERWLISDMMILSLLGYDTTHTGTQLPTFWRSLMTPSSGYLQKDD